MADWIEVRSPHTGRPVRLREKDVGRTVRDGDGNIFYALECADGNGHYGSLTRVGGEEQERKYFEMIEKEEHAKNVADEATQQQVHDARGQKRKSSPLVKLLLVLIVIGLAVAIYLVASGQVKLGGPKPADPAPQDDTQSHSPSSRLRLCAAPNAQQTATLSHPSRCWPATYRF